jgi:hypothetical protein
VAATRLPEGRLAPWPISSVITGRHTRGDPPGPARGPRPPSGTNVPATVETGPPRPATAGRRHDACGTGREPNTKRVFSTGHEGRGDLGRTVDRALEGHGDDPRRGVAHRGQDLGGPGLAELGIGHPAGEVDVPQGHAGEHGHGGDGAHPWHPHSLGTGLPSPGAVASRACAGGGPNRWPAPARRRWSRRLPGPIGTGGTRGRGRRAGLRPGAHPRGPGACSAYAASSSWAVS